jgi:hypothetical protein
MLEKMTNRSTLVIASILILVTFGMSQSTSYTLLGRADEGVGRISLSDTPFYTATNGTVIGERAIDMDSEDPKIEVSFIESRITENFGNVSNLGTFVEHMISLDVIRGNGEGIITSDDGNSTIGWNAYDIGKKKW